MSYLRAGRFPVLVGCLASAFLASMGSAVEITVQNDSVTNSSQVDIQAGFVAGESAAAWLTAPCDGTIVAVQVFWQSLAGTAAPSLEDSITIFEGGVFPIPGPQLAAIVGPVMTDGVLNEFRFLNQEMTIPLSVPVVSGQTFVVSFRFLNTPSAVGPSVANDLDGCQAGSNGLFAIPPNIWFNSCLLGVGGDWFIRAVIECGTPTGACCLGNGVCQNAVTAVDCAALSGFYLGDLTDCAGGQCAAVQGGCCFDDGAGGFVCFEGFTLSDCGLAGGNFLGPGQTCASTPCVVTGACCFSNLSCGDGLTVAQCAAQGGTYMGDNSLCATIVCPDPVGACCFSGGVCLNLTEVDCLQLATNTWMGAGTDCGTAGICAVPCVGDITPAGGNGVVNIDDLVAVLNGFGPCSAPPAPCDADITPAGGNGVVNIDDLVAVLNAFGPCP